MHRPKRQLRAMWGATTMSSNSTRPARQGAERRHMLMARNLLDLQDMMHRIDGEWRRWSPMTSA